MSKLAEFLFEVQMLQKIKRTGYQFLGIGNESVAEHTFTTTIIAWTMAKMEPKIKEKHLLLMCLMHDIPEARIGDINYVQKKYINTNEKYAVSDLITTLPFGSKIESIIKEFNEKKTLEAKFANDADQLSFILNLKYLKDKKYISNISDWINTVKKRLTTTVGKEIFKNISSTNADNWWRNMFVDKD